MTPFRARLTLLLAGFLATPWAGCGGGTAPTDTDTDTAAPALDDVACFPVELGVDCPSAEQAESQLMGMQTCESPVREVVATGAFLREEDVVPTGYGGYAEPGTSDTAEPVTRCCYEAAYKEIQNMDCTPGRPLMADGVQLFARPARRSDWSQAARPTLQGLSASEREALAAFWTEAALLEHASIPAFARQALDLAALGAPPELMRRTSEAMADEIAHAEACFALASAYAGEPVGPGPLPTPDRGPVDLVQLAVEVFREGCVGESLAVGLAAAQLQGATDPVACDVLARIVDDETRHAELAWDIVAWALAEGGEEVRQALLRELARAEVREVGFPDGLPNPHAVRVALFAMQEEVIRPTALELLAA